MDRINCPFADEQLDFSIGSPAKNVEYFLLYYKILHPFSPSTAPALLFGLQKPIPIPITDYRFQGW
jgi:hypothetical protein